MSLNSDRDPINSIKTKKDSIYLYDITKSSGSFITNSSKTRKDSINFYEASENYLKNEIDEFDYEQEELDEIDPQICDYLKDTVYLIVGKISIEYLTLNLFLYVKFEMRRCLISEIRKNFSDLKLTLNDNYSQILKSNIQLIENTVKDKILDTEFLSQFVAESYKIFGGDFEKLKIAILDEAETRFMKIFSNPVKAKFRLRIDPKPRAPIPQISTLSLYERPSVMNNKRLSRSSIMLDENKGRFRFFRNFIFFKIFFPVLVYKTDLAQLHQYSILNDLVTNGSTLNKVIKSLFGFFSACLITFMFYYYLRYLLQTEASKATLLIIMLFLVLTIGLVLDFSKFRCIILLIIPFMATNRGRTLILMNCVTLTSNHIIPNIFKNMESLQFTFNCNKQELESQLLKLSKKHDIFCQLWRKLKT